MRRKASPARRLRLAADAPVMISCYEAGRNGFWLHRYLTGRGDSLSRASSDGYSSILIALFSDKRLSYRYGRNSRVTLITNARVDSSDQRSPSTPVFRSSV
jgi:hypothetical protein